MCGGKRLERVEARCDPDLERLGCVDHRIVEQGRALDTCCVIDQRVVGQRDDLALIAGRAQRGEYMRKVGLHRGYHTGQSGPEACVGRAATYRPQVKEIVGAEVDRHELRRVSMRVQQTGGEVELAALIANVKRVVEPVPGQAPVVVAARQRDETASGLTRTARVDILELENARDHLRIADKVRGVQIVRGRSHRARGVAECDRLAERDVLRAVVCVGECRDAGYQRPGWCGQTYQNPLPG